MPEDSNGEVLECLQRIEGHLQYLRQQWEAWAPVAEAWRTSGLLAARRTMRGAQPPEHTRALFLRRTTAPGREGQ